MHAVTLAFALTLVADSSLSIAQVPAREDVTKENAASVDRRRQRADIEEVTVTAQRREERVQNVPISISVLQGADLDSSTAQGTTDILGRVPGLAISVAAGAAGTLMAVRGVTAPAGYNSGPSPVGYYVDSVPFGLVRMATVPDLNLYDLNRVEVLRGPQGTLYGAGSQNGVVRVLTNDADLEEFELKARTSVSETSAGGGNYRGDMAINVPLVSGKLGARAVVGYQSLSGWLDRPARVNANDALLRNARIKLNAQPTQQLSLGMSAWVARTDFGAPSTSADNRQNQNADFEQVQEDIDTFGLKIGYNFSRFSITSTTSYLEYVNASRIDLAPSGLNGASLYTRVTPRTFAQEVNLSSTQGDRWRWNAGSMYRDGEDRLFQTLSPLFASPQSVNFISKSWAQFGELTRVLFNGKLEITGGLRRVEDDVSTREELRLGNAPQPANPIRRDTKFHATTPRVILTWHPRERLMAYASYSEGFRSGFDQLPSVLAAVPSLASVEPDLLKNYELGTKGRIADGRFSYDASVYYMDWQRVQLPLVVVINGANRAAAVNGPSASGIGFDLALNVEPGEHLKLGATFSWNDLTVDSDVLSGGILLFNRGDRLNMSPEYTVGASAEYDYAFRSGYRTRFSVSGNLVSSLEVAAVAGASRVVSSGDAIGVGRASISVDAPTLWTAMLFVDNFNNEEGAVTKGGLPVFWPRIRPRTIGLQLDCRF